MENVKLTDNLTLYYIEDNMVVEDKIKTLYLSFSFFGQNAEAYLDVASLDKDWLSYIMIESSSDLHSSFCDLIEDNEDVAEKIRELAKKFVVNHDEEVAENEQRANNFHKFYEALGELNKLERKKERKALEHHGVDIQVLANYKLPLKSKISELSKVHFHKALLMDIFGREQLPFVVELIEKSL